jgi:hypothetical protein
MSAKSWRGRADGTHTQKKTNCKYLLWIDCRFDLGGLVKKLTKHLLQKKQQHFICTINIFNESYSTNKKLKGVTLRS